MSTGASCPKMRGTLIVQNGEVVFSPGEGTWTLQGKAVGTNVNASQSRASFDHKTYATKLTATLSDTKAFGTYVTPTCTYAVDLTSF